jgi:hypothetical protein
MRKTTRGEFNWQDPEDWFGAMAALVLISGVLLFGFTIVHFVLKFW